MDDAVERAARAMCDERWGRGEWTGVPGPKELAQARAALDAAGACLCNVGAQECPAHPGHLKTQEEKIAFRKAWDARVEGDAP